jgi:hypothetical protein
MVDLAHEAVALLAVSLGYLLRTVVPYLNLKAGDPTLPFERRYLLAGALLWLTSLWTAMNTIDQLPDLVQSFLPRFPNPWVTWSRSRRGALIQTRSWTT